MLHCLESFSGLQSDRCPTLQNEIQKHLWGGNASSSKQKCDVIITHRQKWNMLNVISCSNVSASHVGPHVLVSLPLDFSLLELYFRCDLLLQIEEIVTVIQDETEGVPIRTVKSFMTKIPSVVTGKTLSPLSPPLYQDIRPFTDLNILHNQEMSHSSWENVCFQMKIGWKCCFVSQTYVRMQRKAPRSKCWRGWCSLPVGFLSLCRSWLSLMTLLSRHARTHTHTQNHTYMATHVTKSCFMLQEQHIWPAYFYLFIITNILITK